MAYDYPIFLIINNSLTVTWAASCPCSPIGVLGWSAPALDARLDTAPESHP